ncbi:MAG TPA: aminotransferase class V-fold PLP-dependent enzyme [Blastocatellia bacterium]|nr:aminotransferase class V-fold PLP-dependent enzyme [Blastocatellia bacterium]
MPNRRNFLQVISSLPLIGALPGLSSAAGTRAGGRDYFKELGVRPFINAAGTYTVLTASLMPPEVVEAMVYASKQFVGLNELQEAAGKRIAELIGCEGAMVTSGAAAALTVGTAACIAGKNPDFIKRIPDLTGMKSEVIIQKSHRYGYDHAVRNCGIKMIEVETAEELEKAVSEKTAMMLFFNDADPKGKIKIEEFVALGKKHGVPTFNDAAADVPPTENLSKYTKMGFDLVTFSGGKMLRGPQSAGLLLGRRDLIEAARLNCSPNSDSIGRGMKVNKEELLGMMVAVELYLKRDAAAEWKELERRVKVLADSVAGIRELKTETHVPPIANHVPHLKLSWDKTLLKLSLADVRKQLREGKPSIEISPYAAPSDSKVEEMMIGVWSLQPGEVDIVARRLREIFHAV